MGFVHKKTEAENLVLLSLKNPFNSKIHLADLKLQTIEKIAIAQLQLRNWGIGATFLLKIAEVRCDCRSASFKLRKCDCGLEISCACPPLMFKKIYTEYLISIPANGLPSTFPHPPSMCCISPAHRVMKSLCRACNLTLFSPCLTGPVDYPFTSRHKGPEFKPQGGTYVKPGFSC